MSLRLVTTLLLLACSGLGMNGCAPLVIGAAATGVAVVHDRRETGTVVQDQDIEVSFWAKLHERQDLGENSKVSVTSYNKVVLLTGWAASSQVAEQIRQLAASAEGVRQVHNELRIGGSEDLLDWGNDSYLTSKVKLALFNVDIADFDPSRVKVVTADAVVYLMGLLRPNEIDAVTERVRVVAGIKRVVRLFETYTGS